MRIRALTIGVLILAAAPAFSQDTDQRFRVFTRELNKAADQLHVPRPIANVVSLEEALKAGASPHAAAWVWVPGGEDLNGVPFYVRGTPVRVSIVWSHLMSAGNYRLRCWARHEMVHVVLGHEFGARDLSESAVHHDQVRKFMEARWKQDSACLIGD